MKKYLIHCLCCLVLCSSWMVADELEDALKFSVPLNGAIDATLAEGEAKGTVHGTLQFVEGMGGKKAMVCGKEGASVIYMKEDNIDFDNPGTMTVWFKIDCEHGAMGPALPFASIGSDINKGLLSLQVVNDPMKICPCRRQIGFMFFSQARRHKAYMVGTGERRICSGWHLICGGWAGNKLFVSLDGTPCKSFELATPLTNADFGYIRKFGIGVNYTKWKYAIADFRIYGKRLSDAEIKSLYDEGMKSLAPVSDTTPVQGNKGK